MAIMIIAMICMGVYMADLPKGSEERTWFFTLHKSIGLTLALLAITRLVWKLISKNGNSNAPFVIPDDVYSTCFRLYFIFIHQVQYEVLGYTSSKVG
jgi:cytochrome b561